MNYPSRRQRGLSVVELMVGVTVGLFVVAAASLVVTTQLRDNRRLLLESQLQQDLRMTMDIVTRELRRGGYAPVPMNLDTGTLMLNSLREATSPAPGVTAGELSVKYRKSNGNNGPYKYWLAVSGSTAAAGAAAAAAGPASTQCPSAARCVVRKQIGADVAQDLTDPAVMSVVSFTITSLPLEPVRLECPNNCTGPDPRACWPQLEVAEFEVSITAQAATDPSVVRTLKSAVRVRNDLIKSNRPGAEICPPLPPSA